MTIWLLHLPLTAQEEARIGERAELLLPYDVLPDLSLITGKENAKSLLQLLHPDDPPEAIASKLERFWPVFNGLLIEDVVAVPLPQSGQVALAEVTKPYLYRVGEDGVDIHAMAVTWYPKRVPLRAFGRNRDLMASGPPMAEIVSPEVRAVIRSRLPHAYNRFAGLKWILALLFVFKLLHYMLQGRRH